MAGSIKWMIYVDDNGRSFATKVDESNGELFGFADYAGDSEGVAVLPIGAKMRKVNLLSQDGRSRRQIPVGSVLNEYWTGESSSVTVNGIAYVVTSTSGERFRRPFALDTAQDDGDAS